MTLPPEFESLRQHVLRNRFMPVPPAERNQSAQKGTDFLGVGLAMLSLLIREGLTPQSSLLDLGCGIGRLAIPATQYLDHEGSYLGIDINLSAIAWCHENITQKYPKFEFAVLNARNDHYRHKAEYGQQPLSRASLPIQAGRRFDAISMFSVFTHLLWADAEWYIQLFHSLLNPNGFALTTWFLINDITRKGIESGRTRWDFDLSTSGPAYLHKGQEKYSQAIAHDEHAILMLAERSGLLLRQPPKLGGWHIGHTGQDVLIFSLRS